MNESDDPIEWNELRASLEEESGPAYWKSFRELAETPQMQEVLENEFPRSASEWHDPQGRRRFLRLMGASLALAGLVGCTQQPPERIAPYVSRPEQLTDDRRLFFATCLPGAGGYAEGLVVESHAGRPVKIEGNPEHPASLGATSVFGQASVLDLYDPDRSQATLHRGQPSSWNRFLGALEEMLATVRPEGGEGLRILTEPVTSPSLGDQILRLLEELPQARWHQYEPLAPNGRLRALRAEAGLDAEPVYRFDRAATIVSIDGDFLYGRPGSVRYAREFTSGRDPEGTMNRLYVAEPTPSVTGSMADHRLRVPAGGAGGILADVAARLGVSVPGEITSSSEEHKAWAEAVAEDLRADAGRSIVLAGSGQPAAVHALAYRINEHLGNHGETVRLIESPMVRPVDQFRSLEELAADVHAGRVSALLVIGGNPVQTAPADLDFAEGFDRVDFTARLGLHVDETSSHCRWHVPARHFLEDWGDHRSFDGTITMQQPLIDPLYEAARSPYEIIGAARGAPGTASHSAVRDYWRGAFGGGDFPRFWDRALELGYVPADEPVDLEEASPDAPADPGPSEGDDQGSSKAGDAGYPQQADRAAGPASETDATTGSELEIVFQSDPSVLDGRFANNGWLQELPKPLTKITWDNAFLLSPATAERLELRSEDLVRAAYGGRTVEGPVWVLPGQADDVVTVRLGYGRSETGRVGRDVGFDANRLRTSDAPDFGAGVRLERVEGTHSVATTQDHFSLHDRDLVREATKSEYERNPDFAARPEQKPAEEETLYPVEEGEEDRPQWGMTIDLNTCTGCGACTAACQAENNIPIVGKEEVLRGREMHWIRVDRYYEGDVDDPSITHQPITCMHCEHAPCEVVCPVNATVHNEEGINEMIYNRCIGTRYCSNNCPYKVRRFNFLAYNADLSESEKLGKNPNVTVRSRGVMEKCTYCIQRIQAARQNADEEERPLRDGDVQTACEQACPTEAITFGDVSDPDSAVSRKKASPRNYGLLVELNTRPRTTYLAGIRNPSEHLLQPTNREETTS